MHSYLTLSVNEAEGRYKVGFVNKLGERQLKNVENRVGLNSIFSWNVLYTNYEEGDSSITSYIRRSLSRV